MLVVLSVPPNVFDVLSRISLVRPFFKFSRVFSAAVPATFLGETRDDPHFPKARGGGANEATGIYILKLLLRSFLATQRALQRSEEI